MVVAVVTRRRDSTLWQLLPVHIPTTLLIPMPSSSSPCCCCCCSSSFSSSYWSSCSSWYCLPLTSTSVTHPATLKTSSFPGLSYAKGIAAELLQSCGNPKPPPSLPKQLKARTNYWLLSSPICFPSPYPRLLQQNHVLALLHQLLLYPLSLSLSLSGALSRARVALQICHRVYLKLLPFWPTILSDLPPLTFSNQIKQAELGC
jgi:hypothetical protein